MKWRAVGFVGVVLAAVVLLLAYVNLDGRTRVSRSTPVPVLVAKQLIPKGTPGSLIASQSMYAPMVLLTKELEVGAIADPAYLRGRVSVVDILPGQQLTATNFTSRG